MEAILGTRGVKTIVIRTLAHSLNWEVETTPDGNRFGSYLGPGKKPTLYLNLFQGAIIPSQKYEGGPGHGFDLIQGWLDARYWYGHRVCVTWAQQLMAISTGLHMQAAIS